MPERQFVAFRLGDQHFGIDIRLVREIVRDVTYTPVTLAPAAEARQPSETRLLAREQGKDALGLLVDGITDVVPGGAEDMEEPPANITGPGMNCLASVLKQRDHLLPILSLPALVSRVLVTTA